MDRTVDLAAGLNIRSRIQTASSDAVPVRWLQRLLSKILFDDFIRLSNTLLISG